MVLRKSVDKLSQKMVIDTTHELYISIRGVSMAKETHSLLKGYKDSKLSKEPAGYNL